MLCWFVFHSAFLCFGITYFRSSQTGASWHTRQALSLKGQGNCEGNNTIASLLRGFLKTSPRQHWSPKGAGSPEHLCRTYQVSKSLKNYKTGSGHVSFFKAFWRMFGESLLPPKVSTAFGKSNEDHQPPAVTWLCCCLHPSPTCIYPSSIYSSDFGNYWFIILIAARCTLRVALKYFS